MKYSIEFTSEFTANDHLRTDKSALALSLHCISGCMGVDTRTCLQTDAAVKFSAFIGSAFVGSRTFGLIRSGLARWFDGIHVGMLLSANRPAILSTRMLSTVFANEGSDYLNRLEPKSYTRSGERSYLAAIPI